MMRVEARRRRRRTLLAGAAALPFAPLAFAQSEPKVEALDAYLAGRRAAHGRLVLDIPRIADNGNSVPMKLAMAGPFAAGAHVQSIHLFSEKNPVPQMAVFKFAQPLERIELESRVRVAGTQRIAAVATLADGSLHVATADITVTVSACIDGS